MKKVFEKWCSISLVLRIAVGLVIGAILGLLDPQHHRQSGKDLRFWCLYW